MTPAASLPCFQVVVEEGIGILGMRPSGLPPDPVIIGHVDEGGWAKLNGVSVGDELVQVNGVGVTEISIVMLDNFLRKMRPLLLTFSADNKRGWARRSKSPSLTALSPRNTGQSVSPRPACEKAVQAQVEPRGHHSPNCYCNVHTVEELAHGRASNLRRAEPAVQAVGSKPVVAERAFAGAFQPPTQLHPRQLPLAPNDNSDCEDGGGASRDLEISRATVTSLDSVDEELLQGLIGTWVYSQFEYEISRLHGRRVLFEQVQFRDASSVVRVSGILRPRGPWLQGEILDKDKVRLGSIRLQRRDGNDIAVSSVMLVHEDEWGPELIAHRKRVEATAMLPPARVGAPVQGHAIL